MVGHLFHKCGEVELTFADKSESIPKAIERIGIKGALKNFFLAILEEIGCGLRGHK